MLKPRDLPLLVVFGTVARQGSFTAAAAALGVPKSVVSENIKALEEKCGVRLLERSTRRLRLTEAGERVLASADAIEATVHGLETLLEDTEASPSGHLKIATTHDLSSYLVAPAVAQLLTEYPAITAEIVADDQVRDLIEGRFDLAVRLGSPRDSGYVMRRLALVDEPIVAVPALAQKYLQNPHPMSLTGAPWVQHSLLSTAQMTFIGPEAPCTVQVNVRGQANSGPALLSMLLAGLGLGVLPEYLLTESLAQGRLVRLCAPWIWRQVSLYALLPSREYPRKSVTQLILALQNHFSLR